MDISVFIRNKRWRVLWCLVVFGTVIFCINAYLLALDFSQLKLFGNELGVQIGKIQDLDVFKKFMGKDKSSGDLPTLYEYYTEGGIRSGLEAPPDSETFRLNGRNITIFSGAIHYFRVHPVYWRDRLRKLRAAGFNTVETYVPWNLHEPEKEYFDFGDKDNDMSEFLNVTEYIKIAQEEDLLVIVRPGPYICAEWDFGGVPSWKYKVASQEFRTSSSKFTHDVKVYFDMLLPILAKLQFMRGGPIIAFQIENEYGALAGNFENQGDNKYLELLRDLFLKNGLGESLLLTSDMPSASGTVGSVEGAIMTANFDRDPERELSILKKLQPDKPLMVMEYWSGWFDHWFEHHHIVPTDHYIGILEEILKYPASVNLYMFHGGTSFGFYNGANVVDGFPKYRPDVNSYDYDAPLSEAGDYTPKYHATAKLVEKYNRVKTKTPPMPPESMKYAYPSLKAEGQLTLPQIIDLLDKSDKTTHHTVKNMEYLDFNNGNGQSFGFIVYRKKDILLSKNPKLKIECEIGDIAIVVVDGVLKSKPLVHESQLTDFGNWESVDNELLLGEELGDGRRKTLDILVENMGRVNYGHYIKDFKQLKGLWDDSDLTGVKLDEVKLQDFEIFALQFKKKWMNSIRFKFNSITELNHRGPTLYQFTFIAEDIYDTFVDMSEWGKGNVFVNGFNIGRYFSVGPPRTLYIPAPLLRVGSNVICVFELFKAGPHLKFSEVPLLGDVISNV